MGFEIRAAGPSSWDDVATVLGATGGLGGCWCMQWRLGSADYQRNGPEGNERQLRETLCSGAPVGVLAYLDGDPVGWCSVSPRADYRRIVRSAVLRLDDLDRSDVWAVPCFFVRDGFRGRGVMPALLDGAIRYATDAGAGVLEGYPADAGGGKRKAALHSGSVRLFTAAGFSEGSPGNGRRVVMRREL